MRRQVGFAPRTRPRSRGGCRPKLCIISALEKPRAQGEPGGRCTRGLRAKRLREARESPQVQAVATGPPCAVVYGLYVISPVNQLLPPSSPRCFGHRRQLGACMGAPGPHDFAVRRMCRSSTGPSPSTAFHPTSVTIAIRPSCRDGTKEINHISGKTKDKNFDAGILNLPIILMRLAKSDCPRRRTSRLRTHLDGVPA